MGTNKYIKYNKSIILKYVINFIRSIFLLTSIYLLFRTGFKDAIFLSISMLFTFIPEIYTKIFGVKIPKYVSLVFCVFIFASQFLGTFMGFYGYKYWDVLLHLSSGILVGVIAIVLLGSLDRTYLMLRNKKIGFIISYILSIGIAGTSVWESMEFISDIIFKTHAQLGSLMDTMQDILCGSLGAIIFSIYIAVRVYQNKSSTLSEMMNINYYEKEYTDEI